MKPSRLTKEHLPAFIYLTDEILTYDFTSERAEYDNMYRAIADEGVSYDNESISERTIRRVFKLRESLRVGKIINDGDSRPELKTLNALTYFHFDKSNPKRFMALAKTYNKEITAHYQAHKPSKKIIDLIFKVPEKLDFIQRNKEKLEDLVLSVTNEKFEILKKKLITANVRFEHFEKNVNNQQKLQDELISQLERRIDQLEEKRKNAFSVYRLFGAFGLFFVSIDYREASLHGFLDDFMNDYEGLTEDTILDDLI